MSSVKWTSGYRKQFLYDVIVMVNQLGRPTYFPTLHCCVYISEETQLTFTCSMLTIETLEKSVKYVQS